MLISIRMQRPLPNKYVVYLSIQFLTSSLSQQGWSSATSHSLAFHSSLFIQIFNFISFSLVIFPLLIVLLIMLIVQLLLLLSALVLYLLLLRRCYHVHHWVLHILLLLLFSSFPRRPWLLVRWLTLVLRRVPPLSLPFLTLGFLHLVCLEVFTFEKSRLFRTDLLRQRGIVLIHFHPRVRFQKFAYWLPTGLVTLQAR